MIPDLRGTLVPDLLPPQGLVLEPSGKILAVVSTPDLHRAILALPLILAFLQTLTERDGALDVSIDGLGDPDAANLTHRAAFEVPHDVDTDADALRAAAGEFRDEGAGFNTDIAILQAATEQNQRTVDAINATIGSVEEACADARAKTDAVGAYALRLLQFVNGTGGGALLPFTG